MPRETVIYTTERIINSVEQFITLQITLKIFNYLETGRAIRTWISANRSEYTWLLEIQPSRNTVEKKNTPKAPKCAEYS